MEIDRSLRYAHPFTIAYIDIDNFQSHQRPVRDMSPAIGAVYDGRRAGRFTRRLVARLGGDEFALLLPETGQGSAQTILSKIQSRS